MADIKSLEHSTLIVPYEVLNKTFRNAQKLIDREISHVNSTGDQLKKLSSKNKVSIENVKNELDLLLDKLEGLKKKSVKAVEQEQHRLLVCQRRLEHVGANQTNMKLDLIQRRHESTNQSSSAAGKRNLLDRMLVNYFLRSGNYETALQLAENSFIKDYVDLDIFMIARDVENSLKAHDATLCLQWCHNNKSKLKKVQSTLELNVRIQVFVELIKSNNRMQAVKYARKNFTSYNNNQVLSLIEKKVISLLAFKLDTKIPRYKEFLQESRWNVLTEQFRKENFLLHQLDTQSIMEVVLQCGLASLKTPHCFHDDEQDQDCPVCYRLFNELAKPLPFAHSSQSRLLCHISGERMNEHNHPLMLPNGNVYGETALQSLICENSGEVICPKTKKSFSSEDIKKVFIM